MAGRKYNNIVEDVYMQCVPTYLPMYYCRGGKPVKRAKIESMVGGEGIIVCVCVRDKCRRKTEILYRQQYILSNNGDSPLLQIDQRLRR